VKLLYSCVDRRMEYLSRPDVDKQHNVLLQLEFVNSLHPKLVLNEVYISRSCSIIYFETC
jgi:hypothetical protein